MSPVIQALLVVGAFGGLADALENPNAAHGGTWYYTQLVIAHAALMAFVFLFVVPLGVIVARYSATWVAHSWFNHHVFTMLLLAGIPFVAAFGLGIQAVGEQFQDPHHIIGLTVFVGFWFQALLETLNHIDNRRNFTPKTPWYHSFHHWLGRLLFLLALANMPIGIYTYLDPPNVAPYVVYGILVGLWLLVLVILEIRYGNA
ncbi:hypothetical protein BZG36_05507, partial [Bifiguratus adelaidae]